MYRYPTDEITSDADALYGYGGGSGLIHLSSLRCNGDESHLLNCSVEEPGADVEYCGHHEDAGVRCPSGELEMHG